MGCGGCAIGETGWLDNCGTNIVTDVKPASVLDSISGDDYYFTCINKVAVFDVGLSC